MENHAAEATKTAFENAVKGGPASVHGMWSSMSAAQRQDLIDRVPQMVGSTNGVPVVARDQANMARLASQKQAVKSKIAHYKELLGESGPGQQGSTGKWTHDREELEQALSELNELEGKLNGPGEYYLLGLDSTANNRGQTIIASGNPDTADHVVTLVPGTYNDLGDAGDYVANNDKLLAEAKQQAPGQEFAAITWADYESPSSLDRVAGASYAEKARDDLAQFQEGLRATHDGPPSHNTVMGHSYGSTVVGYSALEHGLHADDLMFIGSPGTGAEHADQFPVGGEHVWGGTSGGDVIDDLAPSLDPGQYWGEEHGDPHRFGTDPSDPEFGGNVLPTDPKAGHSDYWKEEESLNAMAKVVAGKAGGMRR